MGRQMFEVMDLVGQKEVVLPATPCEGPEGNTVTHSHFRILIVDNVPGAAESLATLVKLWGYEVAAAGHAAGAAEITGPDRPDVVLVDIDMPGTDSFLVPATDQNKLGAPDRLVLPPPFSLRAYDGHLSGRIG